MDASTAAASLGLAVAVATVIGIIKTALPSRLPNRVVPLIALGLSAVAIAVGRATGEIEGAPLELAILTVAQTGEAIGARELFRAVAPRALRVNEPTIG